MAVTACGGVRPAAGDDGRSRLASENLDGAPGARARVAAGVDAAGSGFLPEAFEQFLGGLFNKAKSLVKGAVNLAKKGIQAVGKVLPIGWYATS